MSGGYADLLVRAGLPGGTMTDASGVFGFTCFGFLFSRLLRFCPLAIVDAPSDLDHLADALVAHDDHEGAALFGNTCAELADEPARD